MKCMAARWAVMVMVLLAAAPGWADQPKLDAADERALDERLEAFVVAYNKADAPAVAAFYAPDADYLNVSGEMSKGRAEIEKMFASFFAQNKEARGKVSITSRRLIKPDMVIEDGTWELTGVGQGVPAKGRYTSISIKHDDKWAVVCSRLMVPFQSPKP
jgi:uncharacterized protein (TIGR02246 family)